MQYFVFFDGAYHQLGEDETTQCCGVVIPHGTEFVTEVPDGGKVHVDAPDQPKAKAKK